MKSKSKQRTQTVRMKFNKQLISLFTVLMPCMVSLSSSSSATVAAESVHLNEIDKCWRRDRNWAEHRMNLADCAVGFGSHARGGAGGATYVVTSEKDDDPAHPEPGTLRHGATQKGPTWIVFAKHMNIRLRMPLFVSSHTTIDARGAKVQLSRGPCLFLHNVHHVIIHGLHVHDCVPSQPGDVFMAADDDEPRVVPVSSQDGDGISVAGSSDVWVDHNTMWACNDGLVDVTLGSTRVTISNNRFSRHDKVSLLGHSDDYDADAAMRVTVAFNHFGPGLAERMPRVRFGYAHVANNMYEPWGIYAIGGSSHPTIRSDGNYFVAPAEAYKKQVTWRQGCPAGVPGGSACSSHWLWKSVRDYFVNGATFVASGRGTALPGYSAARNETFKVARGELVPLLTSSAGALSCSPTKACLP